jgi:hypothetical protein
LFEAVEEGPFVDELEAWGHEEPDFFGERFVEQFAFFARAAPVAFECEGREGGWLEGADVALWGLEDVVHVGGGGGGRVD